MKKIICVISEFPEDKFWLAISIESYIKFADKVIIIDGTCSDEFHIPDTIWKNEKIKVIESPYPHEDKGADGKQRNIYLNYVKKHFNGDLCIVVDSDEVLADDAEEQINKIIEVFKLNSKLDIFNPRMEHFIDNFGWVDATKDFHFCPGRIFKISKDLIYPEVEHVLLESNEERKLYVFQPPTQSVLYYHYAYTKGRELIIKKYKKHVIKSNIHTPEFLKQWKDSHLFGTYPKKTFLGEHPKPVKDMFTL